MEQQTVLSSQNGRDSESTVLSSQNGRTAEGTVLSSQYNGMAEGTVLSSQTEDSWRPGLLLKRGDRVKEYTITDFISKSGEAEVYKGTRDGREYAVKLYLNEISLKEGVVNRLVGKEFHNLAHMVEAGEIPIEFRRGEELHKFYEISPLYKEVSKPVPYAELCRMIGQVNEGLHELHGMGIYHKDIKPANIMVDEDNTYRIIDFGISSVAERGQTHINNTVTGISFDYASPDARATSKASPEEDYYSFGISIYEFFTGELPYAELGSANNRYEQLNSIGIRVRESQHMPKELIKLIHGLTFYSNNPELKKKRWGYEKVKQWLEDPSGLEDLDMGQAGSAQTVKKASESGRATTLYKKSFGFHGRQIQDSYTLADELGSHWEEGKKLVGRGYLGDFFQENGSEYVSFRSACEDTRNLLEEAASADEEDLAYWKLVYELEPKLNQFYWNVPKEDGTTGYTCEELGVYFFLKPMQDQKKKGGIPEVTQKLLASGRLSVYLRESLKDEKRYQKALRLQKEYESGDAEKAVWRLGYLLAGKALFTYRGQSFETKKQFYDFLIQWTNSLSLKDAVWAAKTFQNTKEFQAWLESQEE